MKKLPFAVVNDLVDRIAHHVRDLPCDGGVNPRDYLVHIVSSRAFYKLAKVISNTPSAYEDDYPTIVKALAEILPKVCYIYITRSANKNKTLRKRRNVKS